VATPPADAATPEHKERGIYGSGGSTFDIRLSRSAGDGEILLNPHGPFLAGGLPAHSERQI